MNYDNFVFYGSWRESLEGFREEFGDEYAKEVLWNLMLMATAGDIETEKKSIIGFLNGAVMPNINKAKDRYSAAVENGRNGGRPKIELDEIEVKERKAQLKTWKAVAASYGIDEDTLRRIRKQWEKTEKQEKPKNLDIDIDIDKDKEKDIDKQMRTISRQEFLEGEKKGLYSFDKSYVPYDRITGEQLKIE